MGAGYDFSSKQPYRLMQARLGVFEKPPFQDMSIEGINRDALRLRQQGGHRQQERMIKDKRRTLDRAVHFSYQAAEIRKVDAELRMPVRALINPDKLKQDYDDKILSVGYEYGFKPGDVFEWLGTRTHWLVVLQDLTELAYFRADIRKCSYTVNWVDEDGELQTTYLAVRGPVETKIEYIQKNGISTDNPNYSINFLMPKTEATVAYFKRYAKMYLQGGDSYSEQTCWRVEAVDAISMPGVLGINAVEYYANEDTDDIAHGIVDGLIVSPEDPNEETDYIIGETFIEPKQPYVYTFNGSVLNEWYVDTKKYPVRYNADEYRVKLIWDKPTSGQFVLKYGDFEKIIVVQSLF